jgi:hypothetical protein
MILPLLLIFAVDVDAIAKNPGVAKVEVIVPGDRPAIIHVLDWHFVDKSALGKAEGLEGEKLDAEYATVMQTAAAVHKSKLLILAKVPEVFHEGLTDRSNKVFRTELRLLRPYHREIRTFDPETSETTKELIEKHQRKLLRLGAAAELKLDGKPIKILPAEGAAFEGGRTKPLDDATNKAREAAIVNRIAAHGRTSWLVLGGGHDLSEAVKAHQWGYVRVTPKGYPK